MFKNRMISALALSGILLAGCDSKKETATPATPPAAGAGTPTVVAPPAPAMPPAPAATATPAPVVPTITPSADVTPPATPVVPPTAPVTPVAPAVPSASGDVNADAKATLAQFGKDLLAKDWKAAAADLKTLNDEKDKLTPELQDAVKKAQSEYDLAKAGSGLKIPGLGSGDSNK